MEKDKITGRNKIVQKIISLIPKEVRMWFNPNHRSIYKFMQYASASTPRGSKVLDAGAGPGPYKNMFSHCRYEATDCKPDENIDFTCSLDRIPRDSGTYDCVICSEVLEHVEYPGQVLTEIYNILKSEGVGRTKQGGVLYLTCPQGWGLHQEPYHYFNFTKYSLKSMLLNAGFKEHNIIITPKGGYFSMMANILREGPFLWPIALLLSPFLLLLDNLDKKKSWTNGYLVEARK